MAKMRTLPGHAPPDMLVRMSHHPAPSPMLPRAYAGVLGSLIGDLLGVPHEFKFAQMPTGRHNLRHNYKSLAMDTSDARQLVPNATVFKEMMASRTDSGRIC